MDDMDNIGVYYFCAAIFLLFSGLMLDAAFGSGLLLAFLLVVEFFAVMFAVPAFIKHVLQNPRGRTM